MRLAVGTLTELVLAAPASAEPRTGVRRRPFTRTPAFVLAGSPVTVSAVRRELAAAGHGEGGRSPQVVLLVEPLDRALVQVWSARVQQGAPVRWAGCVSRWTARGVLPPSADLPALARSWADRVGVHGVHLVVAPTDAAGATRTVADLLGVRLRETAPHVVPRWRDLSPAAVDVARRVNGVLGVRVGEQRRRQAARTLVAALAGCDPATHPLTVAEQHQDWVRDRARQMAEELGAGGYPVHGRPEDLVPRFTGVPTRPRPAEVLDMVEQGCLAQAARNQRRENQRRGEAT